jgi:hypothetical protein
MVAFNLVRARVLPDREAEFLQANDDPGQGVGDGLRCMSLVRTDEHSYVFVGEWDSLDALAAARPALGRWIEGMRPMLEAWSDGADLSGRVVARMKPKADENDWRSC